MSFLASAFLGLLQVALICAIIIFIAWCIVWLASWMGVAIDGQVLRWGKIIVGLLCIIVVATFLFSLLGGAVYQPFHVIGR